MPRHHCGLQKNVPDAHYIRCARSCAKRSARLGQPGEYRRKKTPRCLPGCL
ncbi:hypothetical protein BURCENBC7_AP7239 [Burkholderia cenocepacia BC7]|nr:hypothetical protein BURCENK562V_C1118 [Burkholderia cenocepacia K56-2Valvano]ERI27584.1 hypothetical protein BURCENBC7_AP7239 [Burkholderia cenocepacia BC7]